LDNEDSLSLRLAWRRANGGELWAAAMVTTRGVCSFSGRIRRGRAAAIAIPKTVIVIGAEPYRPRRGLAVSPAADLALCPHRAGCGILPWPGVVCEAIPGLEMDAVAQRAKARHRGGAPLLARLAPETRVIGITIQANCEIDGCRRLARGLPK